MLTQAISVRLITRARGMPSEHQSGKRGIQILAPQPIITSCRERFEGALVHRHLFFVGEKLR